MHPLRREIYKLICESPGAYFFKIAGDLDTPHGTLSWHLRMLEKAGLIATLKFGGKRCYYPKILRTEEAEKAFVALNSDKAREIFSYIMENEGTYQQEVADELNVHHDTVRWHVKRLKDAELIYSEHDGRRLKYYIDTIGKKLIEGSLNLISERYLRFLIDRLEEGCLSPTIIETTKDRIVIRLECPGVEDCILELDLSKWKFIDGREIEEEEKEPEVEHVATTKV